MVVNELNEHECREVLARASVGRLGCSREDQPYVVPVYFAYEHDYIYVFATVGQKIEWMRSNPKVCMQMDEIGKDGHWVSVIANGRYEELPELGRAEERAHARRLLESHHDWWLNAMAERRTRSEDSSIAPIFFRIHVDSIAGLSAVAETRQTTAPQHR